MTVRQLTFSSYEDSLSGDVEPEEIFLWIIVVAVMGMIILVSIFVIFSMWWFKIRPYEYKTMIEESATSHENLRGDFQIESSPPTTFFEGARSKRESVNISGSTERGMLY